MSLREDKFFGVNYETLSSLIGDRNKAWSHLILDDESFKKPIYEMELFSDIEDIESTFEYFHDEAMGIYDRYSILIDGRNTFPSLNGYAHVLYYEGNRELLFSKKVAVLIQKYPSLKGKSDLIKIAEEMGEDNFTDIFPLDKGGLYSSFALNFNYEGNLIGVSSTLHSLLESTRIIDDDKTLYLSLFGPGVKEERHYIVYRNDLLSELADGVLLVEERDGGVMWRIVDRLITLGRPVMGMKENMANPNNTFFRRDKAKSIKVYSKKGDLKRLFAKSRAPKGHDESERSLFDDIM